MTRLVNCHADDSLCVRRVRAESNASLILVQASLVLRGSYNNHTVATARDDDFGSTAVDTYSGCKGMGVFQLESRLDSGLVEVNLFVSVGRVVLVCFQDVVVATDEVVLGELVAQDGVRAWVHLSHERFDN